MRRRRPGAVISILGWILVVAAAWLVVATIVGVLVGRMIRERDRQIPPAPDASPENETKENPTRHRTGRGRQRRS